MVLLLGVRHGLDADHLATIDALTRLNLPLRPLLARRAGALFSLGHGAVVMVVAWAVSTWLHAWKVPGWLASFGAWTSIAFLLALAFLNAASVMGVVALFAVSFDTVSQAAMFAAAAQRTAGTEAALLCALIFTAGMLATDGLNGLWTARLLRRCDGNAAAASRAMGWAIVAVSLLAAGLGLARQLIDPGMAWADGRELLLGARVVAIVLVGFAVASVRMRASTRRAPTGRTSV